MNISLCFVHEPKLDRQIKQNKNDEIILKKFGSNNFYWLFAYVTSTISGPIISFFKKMALLWL